MENAVHQDGRIRRPGRRLGVLARVALVVGAHVAVLLLLARLDPEVRKRVEPVLVSLITPPAPVEPAPAPPTQPSVVARPVPAIPQRAQARPTPVANAEESAAAIAAHSAAPSPLEHPEASPSASVVAAFKPPAAIVPPRFDAAYLNNPRPDYPRAARRMGEHGKVMLRVYVAASGTAEKVEIRTSSGSPRLDQAARDAVERWKFAPARQGDEPVAAWVLVPITFVLEG